MLRKLFCISLSVALLVAAAVAQVAQASYVYERDVYSSVSVSYGPPKHGRNPAVSRGLKGAKRTFMVTRNITEERWTAADGSFSVLLSQRSAASPASPRDRQGWEQAGSPKLSGLLPWTASKRRMRSYTATAAHGYFLGDGPLAAAMPVANPLSTVPRERGALQAWLVGLAERRSTDQPVVSQCDRSHPDCKPAFVITAPGQPPCKAALRSCPGLADGLVRGDVVTYAVRLLRYPPTPPELRATLKAILTGLTGSRALTAQRDPAGRTADIVLSAREFGVQQAFAFDPATSKLSAQGMAIGGANLDAIRWHATHAVASGQVAQIGQRPR